MFKPKQDSHSRFSFTRQPWRVAGYWLMFAAILLAMASPTSAASGYAARSNLRIAPTSIDDTPPQSQVDPKTPPKPDQESQPPQTQKSGMQLVGKAATAVYGQPNFTSNTANNGGIGANTLSAPTQAITDSLGGLYIADTSNNRVLYYSSTAITTASRVYGQATFTTTTANLGGTPTANTLNSPTGLALDSSGGLYVADFGNNRILYYSPGVTTASAVYGQPNFASNAANQGGTASANTLRGPFSVALDNAGGLYVTDSANNRALYYSPGITTAVRVYGQPDFASVIANNGGVSAGSLNIPQGQIAVDSSNGVYIVDRGNNRVLYYSPGITTANLVYGQPNFNSNASLNGGIAPNSLSGPRGIALDSLGGLYISDATENRILYYSVGITTAKRIYGQPTFISNTANNGGISASSLSAPRLLGLDGSGGLYVADASNNRVLYYPVVSDPASISIVSGDNQTVRANHAPGTAITALVKDSSNNPVGGVDVIFNGPASGPGGHLTIYTTTTDINGLASADFLANGTPGSYTLTATVRQYPTAGSATLNLTNFGTAYTYSNTDGILIPAGAPTSTNGVAGPYPSIITVTNFPGLLNKATVTLHDFSHTFPSDMDLLLVDPNGNKIVLMSAAGGGNDIVDLSFALDSQASQSIAINTQLASRVYKPAFINSPSMPAPAPGGPYTSNLKVANGVSPNGAWNLYVNDSAAQDVGFLGSWNLTLNPAGIIASAGVSQSTAISTTFSQPLTAVVFDTNDNPVTNTQVVFTAPGGGASGTFSNGTNVYTGTTDANGVVTSTAFTANNIAGSYAVTATVPSDPNAGTASFALTNTQGASSVVLDSSPNPSIFGQAVTFTATVTPSAATGTVTFTEGATTLGTGPLSNGTATFSTTTLPVGSHVISATYGGDSNYTGSSSNTITQVVKAPCNPLVVTSITDDGAASTCGTFSYALIQASSAVTITFALTQSNQITFTGQLTPTVKSGVVIDGGSGVGGIILNGNGVSGDGLRLVGNDTLINLTIRKFAGRELVTLGPGNVLKHIVIQQT